MLFGGLFFRLIATLFTLDGKTGFINQDFFAVSTILGILSVGCVAAAAIASAQCEGPAPVEMTVSLKTGIPAIAIAVFSVIDITKMEYSDYYPDWQIILVTAVGVINAAFFLYYAVCGLLRKKVWPVLYTVPLIFCIVKLVRFFAVTSSITLIADNVFTTLYYSSAVVFMLELVNYTNNAGPKHAGKKLLISGYAASMLAIINGLPRLVKLVADKEAVAHESIYSILLSLATGLYIIAVTGEVFRGKNHHAG